MSLKSIKDFTEHAVTSRDAIIHHGNNTTVIVDEMHMIHKRSFQKGENIETIAERYKQAHYRYATRNDCAIYTKWFIYLVWKTGGYEWRMVVVENVAEEVA